LAVGSFWNNARPPPPPLLTPAYLRPDGVLYAHHADGDEVVEDEALVAPHGLGRGGEVPVRHADGPQAGAGHGLDHLLNHLVAVAWPEDARLAHLAEDAVTPGGVGGAEQTVRWAEQMSGGRSKRSCGHGKWSGGRSKRQVGRANCQVSGTNCQVGGANGEVGGANGQVGGVSEPCIELTW